MMYGECLISQAYLAFKQRRKQRGVRLERRKENADNVVIYLRLTRSSFVLINAGMNGWRNHTRSQSLLETRWKKLKKERQFGITQGSISFFRWPAHRYALTSHQQ